ncbi:MAG TPA: ArsR family transcriptional regulator [Patescibacteria group bacterium]|nr:ArsR family transcriptional regulator [Patescibacteria group bacterium]
MQSYRSLERLVRGFSNHRRIEILFLLERGGAATVFGAAGRLKINFRTASEHLRRLHLAGLVQKRSRGAAVEHTITDRGRIILKFLRTLE